MHAKTPGAGAPAAPAPPGDELVALSSRLRFSVARLARLLRQQDGGTLGATASAALATVSRLGQPTLGELAGHEHVAAPTMTKVVAKLEDAGLVSRRTDPSDRRVVRVLLTEAGADHLEENRTRRTAWLVDQLAGLEADDLGRLAAAVPVLEQLTSPQARGER